MCGKQMQLAFIFIHKKTHSPSLCTYSSPASFKSTFAQIVCHRWPLDSHSLPLGSWSCQVPGRPVEIPPLDRHATARTAAEQRLGPGVAVHGAACLVHPMEPGAGIAGDGNGWREKVTPGKLTWLWKVTLIGRDRMIRMRLDHLSESITMLIYWRVLGYYMVPFESGKPSHQRPPG